MQTKEQKRAKFALVQLEKKFGNQVKKDDANFLVGLPTTILTNGLGQSLAFILSKQDKKHSNAFSIIKEWLISAEAGLDELKDKNDDRQFLQAIAGIECSRYLTAQQETLAMLCWLKRYARAFQETDNNKQGS